MGFDSLGLPTGIMFHGRHFDEGTLFTLAYGYEQSTKHRIPSPLFPECTDATYVPLTEVRDASSDAYSLAFAPVAQPLTSSAESSAGRKLKGSGPHQKKRLSGPVLGMSQHTGYNMKLHN